MPNVTRRPRRRKKTTKKTVATLQTKVAALTKSVVMYSQYNLRVASGISADFIVVPLIQPTSWLDIFNSPSGFEARPTAVIRSIGIDSYLSIYTEKDNRMDFTYYLVSLRPGTGQKMMQDCGHNLNTIQNRIHYMKNEADASGYSGQTFLNKSLFKIHYTKRVSLTNRPSPNLVAAVNGAKSTGLDSTFKRFYHKINWGKTLTSKDAVAGWKTSLDIADVPLPARLYIIVFNNNSALDQEYPLLAVNAVITMSA